MGDSQNAAKALAHMPRWVAVPDTLLAQIDVLVSAAGPIPLVDDVLRGLDQARAERDRALGIDPDRPAVPREHHPNCYQVVGVPNDLPDDLCDCRTLRMIDGAGASTKGDES